jgi:mannosyltransferase OCH1-like enzyme
MEVWFILLIIVSTVLMFYCIIKIYRNNVVEKQLYKNINNVQYSGNYKYIPRKIFQLVKDKNNIHPKFQKNIQYIKHLNPGWNYILYDDDDMIEYMKNNFQPEILTLYNKINPDYGPAKADFFRYLLMYNEGGVYFDIKSAMKYPLDNFLKEDDEYILSHWPCKPQTTYTNNKYGELQQWYIMTKPKHPYLKAIINKVIDNIKNYDLKITGTGKLAVLKVTGPIAYTTAILPILFDYQHRIFQTHEFIGLIYDNTENLISDHGNFFSKTHYTKLETPVILNI